MSGRKEKDRRKADKKASLKLVAPIPDLADPVGQAVANIRRWRAEPWNYVREVFKATPDPWQDESLHALVESGKDKFCWKACKGPGKSCLLAWIIWWFLSCFDHPKILCTSITGENLRDGLWAELAHWRNQSEFLKATFEWQTDRVYARDHKETWFASARTWPKDADKSKQANTLAGQHAKNTMIVVDEGGGIPQGVLAAGLAHHSTQDPNVKEVHISLMAGNPTDLDGCLGWACTQDAANWWIKSITGDPNNPMRAPRIDKKWAQEQIDKYGRENPWVLINVFGEFPPVQSNKLLGPDIVRKAQELFVPEPLWINEPKIMGFDVARSLTSDRSVLCRRQGATVFPFKVYRLDDLMQLAGQVAFEWSRWRADAVFIDVIGLGAGVYDRLNELGLPVIPVNSGLPATDPRFTNKRTEMWWNMAMAIKGQGGVPTVALPNMPELLVDLCGPTVEFDERGRMKLTSKEKMKKLGIDSPDIGDALAFTYSEPVFASNRQIPASTLEAIHGVQKFDYDPFNQKEM
jgi:phage terminase large subunit